MAARRKLSLEFGVMLGSDEARENPEPAFGDDEVMIAAAKLDAPHLDHADAAALGAKVYGELFKVDHAVGHRVQLMVGLRRGEIIQEDYHAIERRAEIIENRKDTGEGKRRRG